jgi:NAD(P)-dependent dehydrogenase (short-subunit alcohol dehydrogenase family)
MKTPSRILITGAGRGLGLEFTRQWLERGHHLFALARRPEASDGLAALARAHEGRLHLAPCDVADDRSVERARESVGAKWDALEVILNNAGTYGPREEPLEEVDFDEIRRVHEVNTLGPMRITRAFLPLLRGGSEPRLVHLTSLMGSVADNGSGGSWAYRLSKTALNMASRNMAIQLEGEGIPSVVIHPGWVRTEMGGAAAPLSALESVRSMIETIGGLSMEQSGAFLDRDGQPVPW